MIIILIFMALILGGIGAALHADAEQQVSGYARWCEYQKKKALNPEHGINKKKSQKHIPYGEGRGK